ncbi:MAG: carbon starvation protein A [Methanobacteriota archaeon]|nr:MAG: carbon starvation protein A [Euryarchaeota archaeon]TLZ97626.1 MAG: carbon starvation protein A [Euryarchaeota archaeon]TMA02145.1 MAG: carbon starvation protein A [Euryarchaeota archaeon]
MLATPFLWVVATIALYAVAYWGYGKWIDRNVWRSDAKKATPAHMYMDGVEYFPVSRYVLWGYQFKSVAALGPILGPFIGITFGWLPALLWIIGGNFFIGWLQDYGSMMLSVRKEGRSFGPITYEFTGARGRTNLLAFVLFYLIIISAAFIALIASFWNQFSGTFVATVGILLAGLLCGQLLYRMKMNVFAVTGIGLALVVLSIYLGVRFPITLPWGVWNVPIWGLICAVILYAAAVLPTPMFVQPTNYLAFYPAYAAIILLLVGALATPFTNIPVSMPSGPFLFDPQGILGPIWPILFVAIACGAISGWHSLVSSSSSSKQLDVETDALPVGGGAMLSEGLLALASLIAYMVLLPSDFAGRTNVGAWVLGSVRLTTPFLGSLTGPVLTTFFGLVLIIYALTVQALVTRFFRLVAGETWGEGRFRVLGNKHVSSVVGLAIPWGFAVSGSWWALWLYFGGANQLLAGLAIMLITIHLAKVRAPSRYSLIPGVFMVVTTLAALVWQTGTFLYSVWAYLQNDKTWVLRNVRGPIQTDPNLLILAVAINAVFVIIGAALFVVGVSMAIRLFRSYNRSVAEARAKAPAAADGGTAEKGSP